MGNWTLCPLRQLMIFPLALLVVLTARLTAGDWPQILGPERNGRAQGERLLGSWPKDGPKMVWTHYVGQGYAGPAASGDRVVVFHRVEQSERIEALDAKTGQSLWKTDFPAHYTGGINADLGPRCVPIIDAAGDRIFVYGAAGDLHCVSLSEGKKKWSRRARTDYDAEDGYFGAGSTPIVVGDRILVNVGSRRAGAGLVAFSVDTGETVWTATREEASYSSPASMFFGDKPSVVFVTRMNTICIDPTDGNVLFQFPFGQRGPTVNAATPLVFDDHLFVSASYGIGAKLVKIDGTAVMPVWSKDDVMSSQYSTCVYHAGYLYGTDGREDIGQATLRCIEAKTGSVKWSIDGFGVAHIILVDDKLLIQTVTGDLILAVASSKGFRRLQGARLFPETTRALPALSYGHLYVRSTTSRGGELRCYQVGQTRDKQRTQ